MKLKEAFKSKADELMRGDMRQLRVRFIIGFIQVAVCAVTAIILWPTYWLTIFTVGAVALAVVFYGIEITRIDTD